MLYWLSRWPWLTALLGFFIIAAAVPPFAWYIRTPIILVGALVVLIVAMILRARFVFDAVMRRIEDEN